MRLRQCGRSQLLPTVRGVSRCLRGHEQRNDGDLSHRGDRRDRAGRAGGRRRARRGAGDPLRRRPRRRELRDRRGAPHDRPPPRQRLVPRRLRLAQRHLREPRPHRVAPTAGRRRAADRQVQARLPRPLTMTTSVPEPNTESQPSGEELPSTVRGRQKSLTIGAVCKALKQEFPDISISKIRYLEDQKLLTPRRTQGGYRVYTQTDVQRLRTILRLQRDEFLPLRVIRQELAGGRTDGELEPAPRKPDVRHLRRTAVAVKSPGALYSLEDV